jgi:hypothetical protein
LLAAYNSAGDRRHDHYLKGSVYCGRLRVAVDDL